MELLRGRNEGVLFPTGAQALRMGPGGRDSGGRIQADRETGGESVELFESLRSSGMPQNQQHDRRTDAENGPPSEFDVLLSRKFGGCRIEHQGLGAYSQFRSLQPETVKEHDGWKSPAEWPDKSRYHENWLQNLLTSASMGGYRFAPPNPL